MSRKRDPEAGGMNAKRMVFVKEYLIDLSAAKAAIRAGYSKNSAFRIGYQLLQKKCVKDAIKVEMEERSRRTEISADRVLMELAKIGFCNLADFVTIQDDGIPILDFSRTDRDKMASLSEITQDTYFEGRDDKAVPVKKTRVKLHDKVKSLHLLGNHLGIFRENAGGDDAPMPVKVEVSVVDGRKS
ncbi:MAG: terminase small subunit [Desulfovibrionaceae bacterium]|nr:terminase small subunit [Desulfovibrionaceae bacterium]MBF0514837.1 terminase small subunit [Desulfovibrionaceae bacterium]